MWRISLPPHPSGCQGRWSKLQDHSRTKWKWSPEQSYAGMWTMYVAGVILHCLRINVARVTLNHRTQLILSRYQIYTQLFRLFHQLHQLFHQLHHHPYVHPFRSYPPLLFHPAYVGHFKHARGALTTGTSD